MNARTRYQAAVADLTEGWEQQFAATAIVISLEGETSGATIHWADLWIQHLPSTRCVFSCRVGRLTVISKSSRHPDGRVWSIRSGKDCYFLRLGAAEQQPIVRRRPSEDVQRDVDGLIADQCADGFVAQPDEPA